ncbi:ralBP1-associated Eps domain-containing protein 1 isoform X3 [Patella vulgata]|uniref:ralBP1-associated Eps domain-containing protein 1 isoform X3 n=1 Tax=Patella vulgata TaxID=6465 RepID=UPI00217FC38B|nr:ralBP1-associated Eps domain-containing protein 1 isoform X3 [Patella vulgata]
MEGLKLSDSELQCYGELFQACDSDGTGKITGLKASELFRGSGLGQDALIQISELCGAKRLGHFGRSQFYIALKLIAAVQSGFPLKIESLNTGTDLNLPKFNLKPNDQAGEKKLTPQCIETDNEINIKPGQSSGAGQLPPPPKKSHMRSLSGQYRGIIPDSPQQYNNQALNREETSPRETKSPPFSPQQSPPVSPSNARRQLIKQQTVPANFTTSVPAENLIMTQTSLDGGHVNPVALEGGIYNNETNENGGWAVFEDDDENHMLIGSGVKKWETDTLEPPNFDSSSISSEADSVDDVFCVTDEQRDYYIKQFKTMEPDLSGMISGPVAKEFFEKSKLPVSELSKIWQLSDLNCDGALSLEEFIIAMHLVVLRRNDIDLPERLPLSLMPYATLTNDEPFAADLPQGSTLKRVTPPPDQQWSSNFPVDSPESSGVPSPALKPANFEFAKPIAGDPDSKIVHPVAVRMSPDGQPLPPEGYDRGRALSDPGLHDCDAIAQNDLMTPTKQRSNTESSAADSSQVDGPGSKYNTPLHPRPRPVPKKPNQVPMVGRGHIQPPPFSSQHETSGPERPTVLLPPANDTGAYSQEPPAPPPRPPQSHGRSLSVDLKCRTEGGALMGLLPPPAVPPRVSPKDPPIRKVNEPVGFGAIEATEKSVSFTDSVNLSPKETRHSHIKPKFIIGPIERHRRCLSLDYSKVVGNQFGGGDPAMSSATSNLQLSSDHRIKSPNLLDSGGGEENEPSDKQPIMKTAVRTISRDKREVQMAIRTHKERNSTLTRLNSELNQELQEVMEQRIALEIQLEHLRPYSS